MGYEPLNERILSSAPHALRLAYERGRNAALRGWKLCAYNQHSRRYRWWIAGYNDEQAS